MDRPPLDSVSNQYLKEIRSLSNDCIGVIVALIENEKAIGYWDGSDAMLFGDSDTPYPKVFSTIQAARRRAKILTEEGVYVSILGESLDGKWEPTWWVQPDYVPGKYMKMTGIQYAGSPTQ